MILTTIYYAAPGLVANFMPIIVKRHFKWLAVPVDGNLKLYGKPLFGAHKTLRGFIFGVIGAILILMLQKYWYVNGIARSISYIDYSQVDVLVYGTIFGLGALTGDLLESFVKRRLGIKSGSHFIPWDQLDYVLGIMLFSMLIKPMTWQMVLILLVAGPLLHLIFSRIGYSLGLRKSRWG